METLGLGDRVGPNREEKGMVQDVEGGGFSECAGRSVEKKGKPFRKLRERAECRTLTRK